MKSIQRQLTVRIIIAVLGVSSVAAVALYFHVRSSLTEEFDKTLVAQAKLVAGMMSADEHAKLEFNASDVEIAEFRRPRHPAYFQIRTDAGEVLSRSPSLADHDLPKYSGNKPILLSDLTIPGCGPGRFAAMRFTPRMDADDPSIDRAHWAVPPTLTITVARDRHELDETLRVLATSLLLAALVLAGASALAVTVSVRRGLRPLNQLARQADAIGAATLSQQFPTQGVPAELLPICHGLNQLLDRLREAFNRERRFTADAAHELRTPIAELRSLAEVALKWSGETAPEQDYRDVLNIALQMENTVTTLLAIARCDAGAGSLEASPLDLAKVVYEAWQPHESAALSRDLAVELDIKEPVIVSTSRPMFVPLLGNLLSNAVAYTPSGRRIMCRLAAIDGHAELTVSNDSVGLSSEDLPHMFEPFWRKDPARAGTLHSGLGLALVAAYARALGVGITNQLSDDHVFSIRIRMRVAIP